MLFHKYVFISLKNHIIIPEVQPRIFWAGGYLEMAHFDQRFMYDVKKKGGKKILVSFLLDIPKTAF